MNSYLELIHSNASKGELNAAYIAARKQLMKTHFEPNLEPKESIGKVLEKYNAFAAKWSIQIQKLTQLTASNLSKTHLDPTVVQEAHEARRQQTTMTLQDYDALVVSPVDSDVLMDSDAQMESVDSVEPMQVSNDEAREMTTLELLETELTISGHGLGLSGHGLDLSGQGQDMDEDLGIGSSFDF